MLSKSLGSARASIRDFFHGSLSHRRRQAKKTCWSQGVDEWGRTEAKRQAERESSKQETSDDTFFTTCSVQSNLTDVPLLEKDDAIIKDGPHRTVDLHHVDGVLGCPGALTANASADIQQGNGNLTPVDTGYSAPDVGTDQGIYLCDHRGRCRSGDWRISNSTLFAYNAMKGCSHAEKTELYAWLKSHHGYCGPDSDCSLLLRRLESWDLKTSREEPDEGRVFSVSRPYATTTQWREADKPDGPGREESPKTERQFDAQTAPQGYAATASGCFPGRHGSQGQTRTDGPDPYISDHEDERGGRISPNTFRIWTAGCAGVASSHNAEHASAPMPCHVPDPIDLAPDDSTTASTSSISSSDKRRDILGWQRRQHLHAYAEPSTPTRLPNTVYTVTLPQVQNALSHPSAPPTFHNIPKAAYGAALDHRASFLDDSQHYMAALTAAKTQLVSEMPLLQGILDRVSAHGDRIMRRRYPARTDAERAAQREREHVYRYLEAYMRELGTEYDARHEKMRRMAAEVDRLREKVGDLRVRIEAVGGMVGVGTGDVNGDLAEMERLVRMIDEREREEMGGEMAEGEGEGGCF